jgi:hypothetical protein
MEHNLQVFLVCFILLKALGPLAIPHINILLLLQDIIQDVHAPPPPQMDSSKVTAFTVACKAHK